jgi:peptide/nickel transport system ATP-binding protein
LLFISHDLAVVSYLADEIAVIYRGQLVQLSPADKLFQPPYHPYTEALLSAVPAPSLERQLSRIRLEDVSWKGGDQGCSFHNRCPRFLGEKCATLSPPWQKEQYGVQILCHIPLDELISLQSSSKENGFNENMSQDALED